MVVDVSVVHIVVAFVHGVVVSGVARGIVVAVVVVVVGEVDTHQVVVVVVVD